MLKNTLLGNLSMNLSRMDKLQNQLASGRKYGHISDDPAALIYGQAARNKMARLSHYQATVETAQSWLTQAEMGVMEVNKVIGAVYEELVSAGSVKTPDDKKNLAMVVNQLRDHYVDTLNTAYGDRFVFSGYNTPGDNSLGRPNDGIKPFAIDENGDLLFNGFNISQFDKMPAGLLNLDLLGAADPAAALEDFITTLENPDGSLKYPPPTGMDDFVADFPVFADADAALDALMMMQQLKNDLISFDVGPAISMPVTLNGIDLVFYTAKDENTGEPIMRNTFNVLTDVYNAINGIAPDDPLTTDELTKMIKTVQDAQNHVLTKTAELGGRQRRLELLDARYSQDAINYEQMRSDAEDADMAEVIMYLKMAETVYQAALSAGARIIQPTLMDFLR